MISPARLSSALGSNLVFIGRSLLQSGGLARLFQRESNLVARFRSNTAARVIDLRIMSPSRQFPPYISYLIVTVMSVALLAIQATIPFKIKALGGDFGAVGLLFMWASFWYVMAGLFLGWISHHVG